MNRRQFCQTAISAALGGTLAIRACRKVCLTDTRRTQNFKKILRKFIGSLQAEKHLQGG